MTIASSQSSLVRSLPDGAVRVEIPAAPCHVPVVTARNEAIDVVRFLAAAGVVFVHAVQSPAFDNWGNLFRFAVPFYLFASMYYQALSLKRNPKRTLGQQIAARFRRLYVPFLAWSLIYLVARDIKRVTVLHVAPLALRPELLWKGPEYHLWFLPFLLLWSIILAVAQRGLVRRGRSWRWVAITAAVGAGVVFAFVHMPASWSEAFDNPTYTYVQWWRALPAVCWGMAFAWIMALGATVYTVSPMVGLAGIALAVGWLLQQVWYGNEPGPRGMTGLGCMVAALAPWHGAAVSAMARLGRYGYGVYLCHVLAVEFIHVFTARIHLAPSAWLDVANFAMSFAVSLAMVATFARSRRLAWLNG